MKAFRRRFSGLIALSVFAFGLICSLSAQTSSGSDAHSTLPDPAYGPEAALEFSLSYRGDRHVAGTLHCFPDARGIPFADTKNIIPMTASLWTPAELTADFRKRMAQMQPKDRKKGIIVLLKTERCCTKEFRACTVTTAALEKRSTPLAAEFLIYGVWLKPRDHDTPPGSLKIETGVDEWKNDAAGVYDFVQGPGATLAFIDPIRGVIIDHTNASRLGLYERAFLSNAGKTPLLHDKLREELELITAASANVTRFKENPEPTAADTAVMRGAVVRSAALAIVAHP